MPNIDNLNFEVIINDKDFNKKIQDMEATAKKFNTSISNLLNIQKVSQQWSQEDVENNRRAHQAKVDEARAQEKINREKIKTDGLQRKINAQINRATKGYSEQVSILKQMQSIALGYLSINGAAQLLSSLVRVTGEFELQRTTLAAMLQDMSQAENIMTRIKGLAVESPFTFGELSTYTKQLSAFSVPTKELYETTKMLADISAGLGVGMDRIVLAYGQVRSAAFLRGQEVRQFTEAGIPILQELAKQFEELEGQAVSAGEVFDRISSRLVPFEMVAKVLKNMTSEGGKFYQMQSIQSETLRGKVLKLKDAYQIMLNEIGESKSGGLKNALDGVQNLMKNWAKVGAILKTIIVTFGTYQGALTLVWMGEKVLAGVQLYKKWQQLNAITLALTGNTHKFATALQVLGKSAKVAFGVVLGLLAGVVTATVSAVQNARSLNNELESIMTSELSGSNKTVADLERLKEKLKNATQGSQEYREAISELNRKYGEYLPKIYSEKDAYDAVAVAANGAAEAIRNKAKASAFEKGSAAIEENYGEGVTKSMKEFKELLMDLDPSISSELATEFMQNFKSTIEKSGPGVDVLKTFRESFDKYFGEGKYAEFTKLFVPAALEDAAKGYAKVVKKVAKAENNLQEEINIRFGEAQFSSIAEREEISKVDEWYKKEQENLKKLKISQEEYNDKVEDLDLQKLQKLVEVYTKLGRTDIAKDYQSQIESLTKVPEGWRGKVQNVLKGMNLGKNTSFGLWADETTRSVSYVEDMVKRYKELDDEIKSVSPFDTKQAERLKTELSAIKAISKALNIDIKELAATGANTAESKEEKRLKRLIASLRTLQDQYEKLKSVGASDDAIKTLFEGLYPDLVKEMGKDFVTDLKFIERAVKLANELEKIDSDAGKKALVDLGKDEFSEYYNKLKQQEKAYKDSAEAAKKYFNLLRKWSTEDFNINGEGITLDVSKIASELSSKINEIELTATKAKEIFGQIDVDSEEDIAKVKEIFVKEFGEDAWIEFWNAYYTKGTAAIDALALKQKEYESKLAQEKVNDLAKKYVTETYTLESIDFSDLGDKSLSQLRNIKKKLQGLLNQEPLQVPIEIQQDIADLGYDISDLTDIDIDTMFMGLEDVGGYIDEGTKSLLRLIQQIQKAGLSTETFGEAVKKVFKDGLEKLSEEELKALAQLGKLVGKEILSIASAMGELAEATDNAELADTAKAFEKMGQMANSVMSGFASGGVPGAIIAGVSSLISNVIEGITESQNALHNATVAASEYAGALQRIEFENLMESYDSIFGEDELGKMRAASKEADNYAQAISDAAKRINTSQQELSDIYTPGGRMYGDLDKMKEAFGYQVGDIFVDMRTKLQKLLGTRKDLLQTFNINDFFDVDGKLMGDKLSEFYNTYKDRMSKENKLIIEEMLRSYEVYEETEKEVSAYLEDIFGQVASSMADSFIDAFKASGEAALDYADLMDDVATSIAKSVVESMILDEIVDKDKISQMSKLLESGDEAGALAIMEETMKAAEQLAPRIQSFLEKLRPYFQMEDEDTVTLGGGIKGITEDTANLLASYLNAIRADVSYAKVLWQSMDANTRSIAAALAGFSAPSLMEYQAQIAANTYNTAMNTQSIMEDLRSVITTTDGPTGIRVYS